MLILLTCLNHPSSVRLKSYAVTSAFPDMASLANMASPYGTNRALARRGAGYAAARVAGPVCHEGATLYLRSAAPI